MTKPLLVTNSRNVEIIATPDTPATSGLSTPKRVPTSPSWQADKTASHKACTAASPSECPSKRGVSGHCNPASEHGPLSPNLWASTPTPVRSLEMFIV